MPTTTDPAACADALIAAYNDKDFDRLEQLIAADLDFAHFNRGFAFSSRDELLEVLRQFAGELMPDRRFDEPLRVHALRDTVIREAHWRGTAQVEIPGIAAAGDRVDWRLCSVLTFDRDGVLVEWKDYG